MEFVKPTNIIKCDTLDYFDMQIDMLISSYFNKHVKGKDNKKYDEYFPEKLLPDICDIILSYLLFFIKEDVLHLTIPFNQILYNNTIKRLNGIFFCGLNEDIPSISDELELSFSGITSKISGYYPLYLFDIPYTAIYSVNITDHERYIILKIINIYNVNIKGSDHVILWKKNHVKEFKTSTEAIDYMNYNSIHHDLLKISNGSIGICFGP